MSGREAANKVLLLEFRWLFEACVGGAFLFLLGGTIGVIGKSIADASTPPLKGWPVDLLGPEFINRSLLRQEKSINYQTASGFLGALALASLVIPVSAFGEALMVRKLYSAGGSPNLTLISATKAAFYVTSIAMSFQIFYYIGLDTVVLHLYREETTTTPFSETSKQAIFITYWILQRIGGFLYLANFFVLSIALLGSSYAVRRHRSFSNKFSCFCAFIGLGCLLVCGLVLGNILRHYNSGKSPSITFGGPFWVPVMVTSSTIVGILIPVWMVWLAWQLRSVKVHASDFDLDPLTGGHRARGMQLHEGQGSGVLDVSSEGVEYD